MFHLINFQLPLIISLLIILVAAKILGEVAAQLGQTSMIGKVVAGLYRSTSFTIGLGLNARGIMEMVIDRSGPRGPHIHLS